MMTEWIDYHLARAIAMAVLHSLWQGALIVGIIAVGLRSGYLRTAEQKFFANLAGVITLLIGTLITFVFLYREAHTSQDVLIPVLDLIAGHNGIAESAGRWAFDWQRAITMTWGLGVVLFFVRMSVGWTQIRKITTRASQSGMHWQQRVSQLVRKLGIRTQVRLLSSDDTSVPFVFGMLRPIIVFPASYFTQLTPAQLESILIHELAHIRRHDFLFNCVQLIAESLLFYNPATWWLGNQMRLYREYSCDDRVQNMMHNQKTYLEALYKVAELSVIQPPHAVTLFNNNSELIMRVKRMLNTSHQTRPLRPFLSTAIGLVAMIGLFVFQSGNWLTAQQTTSESATKLEPIEIIEPIVIEVTPILENVMLEIENIVELVVDIEPLVAEILLELEPILENFPEVVALEQIEPMMIEIMEIIPAIIEPLAVLEVETVMEMIGLDTVPDSEKLRKLQKELEIKAQEMDELAARLDVEMEENIEVDAAKMEALAEKLEAIHEEKMAKFEEQFESSDAMQRLESLGEEMEAQMEDIGAQIEAAFDEGLMQALEAEMQALELEYEGHDTITAEMRRKMHDEMRQISERMRDATKELRAQQSEMRNNPDLKRIREEMIAVQKEMQPFHEAQREMWTGEAAELRDQLHEMQKIMHEKMSGMGKELREQMRAKSKELRDVQQRIHEEMRRLNKASGDQ